MMKPRKLVENIKSGDVWIETDSKDYQKTLDAYMEAKDTKIAPCPCIKGHLMFKRPQDYGCRFV